MPQAFMAKEKSKIMGLDKAQIMSPSEGDICERKYNDFQEILLSGGKKVQNSICSKLHLCKKEAKKDKKHIYLVIQCEQKEK